MDPSSPDHPFAVFIEVHAASWRFTRASPSEPHILAAELIHPSAMSGDLFVAHRAVASRRRLEEQLGFVFPEQAMEALGAIPLRATSSWGASSPEAGWVHQTRYQPWRASTVHIGAQPPVSYGRLLHDTPPLRTWENGPHRVDIIAITPTRTGSGDPANAVSFRLWHGGQVLVADDAVLPATLTLDDDTLRLLADYAVHGRPRSMLTSRQQTLLDAHGGDLLDVLTIPPEPYPVGTRVTLLSDQGDLRTTGVVVDSIGDPPRYCVRPDVASLPGHPLANHPDAFLIFSALTARATLRPQDTGIEPADVAVLGYGARVRAVDDPHFETGTVLRAIAVENAGLFYDVQPDGSHPLVRIPEGDVVPLAGTAWQTLDALVEARTEAGIPLEVGEVLVSLDEFTVVESGPAGPQVCRPGYGIPALDPMFGRAWAPGPSTDGLPDHDLEPSTGAPYLEVGEDIVVHDPVHGFLAVAPPLFDAALRLDAETLTRLVNEVPGIEVTGIEAPATLAALAATYRHDVLMEKGPNGPDRYEDCPTEPADGLPHDLPAAIPTELEPPF
ncbi:hypothetical protein ND748_01125 [Frankia sp. AiPs1]|uniref:hypothetical protein n=1 Tax=Frankia sp. AiPs1 TaxID=573493 RepID=UPI002044668C|nr:hypothetical protein [Frankia sp. AiPs1]MCM3920291.1 hypothetical protein [Frankia sp. AiPs1]